MLWINFLHLYQPVNTDAHIIKEATDVSYQRIISALERNPDIKFTLNLNGSLLIRFEDLGYLDLVKRIKKLVEKGQIEITGTACYHPLLPLIPEREVEIQIQENEEVLKKHFGDSFKPKGFYLPEMAYSPSVAKIIKKMGYEWIILDEIAYSGQLDEADINAQYVDDNSGLKIILRSREHSNSYVPEMITTMLKSKEKVDLVVTATDGELYGLRHQDPTGIFEKVLKRRGYETKTISEFFDEDRKVINIKPISHSWATSEIELKKHEPFNLWQEKTNTVQKKLWQLANFTYEIIEKYKEDENYYWARWHYVRGIASCTFWWASAKDFHLFGPLSWSPDEIERGTNELIRAVRALESDETREEKVKAEKLYIAIKKMVWERHWRYYWKK